MNACVLVSRPSPALAAAGMCTGGFPEELPVVKTERVASAPPSAKVATTNLKGVLVMCSFAWFVVLLLSICSMVMPRRWLLLCLGEV